MLNGIGGRTIAEAKERMSHAEFFAWCTYIQKRGSLNFGQRLEQGVALLASVVNRSAGGKAQMSDFLPDREEKDMASIEGVFRMLKVKAEESRRGRA